MLYLKNSLVNLTIIFFSLFFLTFTSADDSSFIFPKKKIITITSDEKKLDNVEISKKFISITLPKKNPLRQNSAQLKKKENSEKIYEVVEKKKISNNKTTTGLSKKKHVSQKKIKNLNKVKPFLEIETQAKINQIKERVNLKTTQQIIKSNNVFLYPSKKPLVYSNVSTKTQSKSKILKEKDYTLAKNIFNLIKKSKWNAAIAQTEKVTDKEFKNLVTWLYLKQSGNQATFSDYKNFIDKNSNYPRIGRLRYMAEHKIILENTTPKTVVNWFAGNDPLSGTGEIKLGEAYLEIGEVELGNNLIKSGWVKADLSKRDVRYYRKKFKKILGTSDHLKRADYLAWNNKYWDLKRMLPYLPKNEKLLYNARFILMTNSYGVDKAISDVPKELINDLGLQYNRLKWRTRRNRLDGSLEILRKVHGEETLVYPELWWKLRENITRDLIYAKKYALAYEVSSNHHLKEGPEFADAEWISGWLALSFLNRSELAINHFKNFYNNVGYPISLARGAFWLGLAHEKNNNLNEAKNYFTESSKFTNTYYGQLSFNKIKLGQDFKLSTEHKISDGYEKNLIKMN